MRRSLVIVALALALPSVAHAQDTWSAYPSSVYREGPGLRIGSSPLVFHPGVILEGGYDTNVFYAPAGQERGSAILRLRAHFDIATLPPQRLEGDPGTADPKIDFRFSTQVDYREYLTSDYETQQQRSLNFFAVADLGILPRGPFTLRINDTFIRTVDPRNYELPIGVAVGSAKGSGNFSRDYNRGGLIMSYRMGRIEFGVGDSVEYNHWEAPDLRFDMVHNDAEAFLRYRFLPQTVAAVVVRVGFVDYFHTPQFEAVPVRAYASVNSLITRWLGTYAYVGYGNSLHLAAGTQSFNSAIAHAELRFFLPKGSRISLGYDRDFFDSLFANYYVDDAGFVAFDQPLVYRLIAHLDASVRYRQYHGLGAPADYGLSGFDPSDHRNDIVYDLHAELSVKATDWLALALNYNLQGDVTSFLFKSCPGPDPTATTCVDAMGNDLTQSTHASYLKHSVFFRVDFAY